MDKLYVTVILLLVIYLAPATMGAEITKRVKVSGFFGNEVCIGYEDLFIDTSLGPPTAKNCINLTMFTPEQYENVSLEDSKNVSLPTNITVFEPFTVGVYEITIFKINAT